jgi:hypothetical protein
MIVIFKQRHDLKGEFAPGREVYIDFNNDKSIKGGITVEKVHKKNGKVTYDLAVPYGENKKVILKEVDSSIVCADPEI